MGNPETRRGAPFSIGKVKSLVTGQPGAAAHAPRSGSLSFVRPDNFVFVIQAFWRNSNSREMFLFKQRKWTAFRLVRRGRRERVFRFKLRSEFAPAPQDAMESHRRHQVVAKIGLWHRRNFA